MTITGSRQPIAFSVLSSSTPSMPGMRTSLMMQPRESGFRASRKAAAEENPRGLSLSERSNMTSESNAASSSSTTNTVRSAAGVITIHTRPRQYETKGGASQRAGFDPDPPAMVFYYSATDRKA